MNAEELELVKVLKKRLWSIKSGELIAAVDALGGACDRLNDLAVLFNGYWPELNSIRGMFSDAWVEVFRTQMCLELFLELTGVERPIQRCDRWSEIKAKSVEKLGLPSAILELKDLKEIVIDRGEASK